MPYTIPPVVAGTAMSAATVRSDLEVIRTWLNGGATAADITTGMTTGKVLSPEVTGDVTAGNSRGVLQDTAWGTVLEDDMDRFFTFYQLTGVGTYAVVPRLARTVYIRQASSVHVRASWYAWERDCAKVEATNNPETVQAATFKLFYQYANMPATARDHTATRLWNSGSGLNVSSRKQLSCVDYFNTVLAGWWSIWVGVLVTDHADVDGITVQPRNFNINVHYF